MKGKAFDGYPGPGYSYTSSIPIAAVYRIAVFWPSGCINISCGNDSCFRVSITNYSKNQFAGSNESES